MLNWSEIEPLIEQKLKTIFNNDDYHNLSIYERRKKIYDYLCDTLEFDEEELYNQNKDIKKEIMDVLNNNKGICNSISYVYKILLEKVNVYSLVLFCKDEDDMHTILLVDNGNGTLSFDDISIGIYSKKVSGVGISIEERFDYDLEDAKDMNQGIRKIDNNNNYLELPSESVNYFMGKKDESYKNVKPKNVKEEDSFAELAWLIESQKKQSIIVR
ncbi:MAG: hypothetical protein PHU45_05065 [Bacilli bacterium]|nr:hypothetical protein [Bacilli bacterium]